MDLLRTPDACFEGLPGYEFEPHYLKVPTGDKGGDLRIHYVDEGPKNGPVVLCLHGEPSWSYLYRKMIPVFAEAGCRVIAPDLPGFGKSDKPRRRDDYTYERHVAWMAGVITRLDLKEITLVCQDWGGLIGLRLVAEHPERFARVVTANTGLPVGDGPLSEAFMKWREFSQDVEVFEVGKIVAGGCATDVPEEVIAAYDAPFPDEAYKEGALQFPVLVPIGEDDPAVAANKQAWEVLSKWEKPWLTAFSDSDPITQGGEKIFQERIPGAKGQPHTTIKNGGHFLQEDQGEEFAKVVLDFMGRS
ncbi:MAG: haloalkane dehalogenase [Alphaproteobacteria bacterium]|nr:haloalkane dehalogenase [Alphaproteobacteria bacterium]